MTGSGESVFVTERSASAMTAVVSVSLSLARLGSVVAETTMTVLLIVAPAGVAASMLTTKSKVAPAPAARVALVALTVPVPPTGGVVSVAAGPLVWENETKVVPAGTVSFTTTSWASDGPALVTVIV